MQTVAEWGSPGTPVCFVCVNTSELLITVCAGIFTPKCVKCAFEGNNSTYLTLVDLRS